MCKEEKKTVPMLHGSRKEMVKEKRAPWELLFHSYCSVKLEWPRKEEEMVKDPDEEKRSDAVWER